MITPEQQQRIDEWKQSTGYTPPTQGGNWYQKVQEVSAILPKPTADEISAEKYKPTFPSSVQSGPGAEGAKFLGNIPSSAKEFGKGLSKMPYNIGQQVGAIGLGFTEFAKEEGVLPAFGAVIKEIPSHVLPEAKNLIPAFLRNLATGNTEEAQRDLVNDPAQLFQIAFLARDLAHRTGVGKQFDDVVSMGAKPVMTPARAVKEKAQAPFEKSFARETAEAFEIEGIKPPVSAITTSPFLRGAEALAAKSPFGRKIIETVTEATRKIEQKTNEIVERVSPKKALSDENLGKTFQEGLKEYEDNFKVTESKVYEEFGTQYGKSPTTAFNTKDMLNRIISEQGKDFFRGIDRRLQTMFDKLIGETPEIKALRKEGLPENIVQQQIKEPELTFNELKATRTSVGEQLSRDPSDTGLKRLYGALSQDMERAVSKIDDTAAQQLNQLNINYRTGKQKIEGNIAQSIEKSNPERIAQNLFKRNSADTIATVKEIVGPERFKTISEAFMRKLFEDSQTRGKFDVAKFKSKLAEFDNATLDEWLTSQQQTQIREAMGQLERMQKLSEAMKPGERIREGSQTAFLVREQARFTGFAAALFSGNFQIAASILAATGLEFAGTRLFTTEAGRKFLTEGFNTGGVTTPKNITP